MATSITTILEEHKVREEDLREDEKETQSLEAQTQEGRFVIEQFYTNLPE